MKTKTRSIIALAGAITVSSAVAGYYLSTKEPVWEREIVCPPAYALAFSPDGKYISVSGDDRGKHIGTQVIRVADGTSVLTLATGTMSSAWNVDGSILAVPDFDQRQIGLWDPLTWKKRDSREMGAGTR